MSDEFCCKFNQFGYCKFGNTRKRFHVKETCTNFPCLLDGCPSRHPPPCKFFSHFGKCKFNEACSFLHLSPKDKFSEAQKEIETLHSEITALKSNLQLVQNILSKMDSFEKDIDELKTALNRQKSQPEFFTCDDCDHTSESASQLEQHRETNHEKCTDKHAVQKFKCGLCSYESTSKRGVNIHKGSKHKGVSSSPVLTSKSSTSSEVSTLTILSGSPASSTTSSSTTSSSRQITSLKPPLPCRNRIDGCKSIVSDYFDNLIVICSECITSLTNLQMTSPFSPQLCPACHQPSGGGKFSFCSLCIDWIQEDGFRESDWGAWALNRDSGEIICIQLDF